MNIPELTAAFQKEGLLDAHIDDSTKTFITREKAWAFNQRKNVPDVFGICHTDDDQYMLFITDSERGIAIYSALFETEAEACDALLNIIRVEERIYKRHLQQNQENVETAEDK